MDGKQGHVNPSIQRRVIKVLIGVVLLVTAAGAAVSYWTSWRTAHVLQDDVLFQISDLIDKQRVTFGPEKPVVRLDDEDNDSFVFIQILDDAMSPASNASVPHVLPIPANLSNGWHSLRTPTGTYRLYISQTAAGHRIAVAQAQSFRDHIATMGAIRTAIPLLVLIPILAILIALLVRSNMRPVKALARDIDGRSDQDLRTIPTRHVPVELQPFILAINRLLGRIRTTVEAQRRFVADAAHELRSPLTALSLQADRLGQASMSGQARERLHSLQQGISRNRNLLQQLLDLTRAQTATSVADEPVSVRETCRRVFEDIMPLAEARGIDVGLTTMTDPYLHVARIDLFTLIRNLVDNAVRYAHDGGHVDVRITTQDRTVTLQVSDDGPGIPVDERERIADAFYRVPGTVQPGSGLGLSVVKAIATRLEADVTFATAMPDEDRGLRVSVIFLKSPGGRHSDT